MYVYYTVEHSTSQMGQFSSFCCWSRHLEVSRQMIFGGHASSMSARPHFVLNTRTGPEKSDLRTLMQAPAVMPRSASLLHATPRDAYYLYFITWPEACRMALASQFRSPFHLPLYILRIFCNINITFIQLSATKDKNIGLDNISAA